MKKRILSFFFRLLFIVLILGSGAGPELAAGDVGYPTPDSISALIRNQNRSFLDLSSLIIPGQCIGGYRVGATYKELSAKYQLNPGRGFGGLIMVQVPGQVEIVFASPNPFQAVDDAIVVAVSTLDGSQFRGFVSPGKTRQEIERVFGRPTEVVKSLVFYKYGFGVLYDTVDSPDAIAVKISIYAPYNVELKAPEMAHSDGPYISTPSIIDAKQITVVDMHLHAGKYGRMAIASKQFLIGNLPPFIQIYAPALLGQVPDPYAPYLGIKDQTKLGGISHTVLLAMYAQKTTGFETNEELEKTLTDPRNIAADGLPWAWGLASINWFDGYVTKEGNVNKLISGYRLWTLSSYFQRRRDLFIGIKLAHAHQGVAFDDERYYGVYNVAAKHNVPVYLHTGFSPFPGSMTEAVYYDPIYLEDVITRYPKVKFILGHIGQGDARAMEHALSMAETYDNVYLEISAIKGPFFRDANGNDIRPDFTRPQYPYVIEQIKVRGLIDKTFYGSDGPQSAGFTADYARLMQKTMIEKGYTSEEIAKVMSRNFFMIYFPDSNY